jgi:hypothetical protein
MKVIMPLCICFGSRTDEVARNVFNVAKVSPSGNSFIDLSVSDYVSVNEMLWAREGRGTVDCSCGLPRCC